MNHFDRNLSLKLLVEDSSSLIGLMEFFSKLLRVPRLSFEALDVIKQQPLNGWRA